MRDLEPIKQYNAEYMDILASAERKYLSKRRISRQNSLIKDIASKSDEIKRTLNANDYV